MDFLTQCLRRQPKQIRLAAATNTNTADEKSAQTVDSFITTLYTAEKPDSELQQSLNNDFNKPIRTTNLRQSFARAIFEALRKAIETARPMGLALGEIYERVVDVIDTIEGFARNHPIICSVIALGILVVVAPWVLEALGFAEGGILEDSFAALWQSEYAGFVPKGSLFSLLQRLGMKGFVRGCASAETLDVGSVKGVARLANL